MRIVSLLPSATEIICGLGLGDQLVGVTHECDSPAMVTGLPKVTHTLIPEEASSREIDALVRERLKTEHALYSLNMPVLESLAPDLIVTQTLCDVCAVSQREVSAAACSLPYAPRVLNLEPTCLSDVLDSIGQVAEAAGCVSQGERSRESLQRRIDTVAQRSRSIGRRPSVMLLEWIDPPFSAGHWNPELVAIAGGDEAIGVPAARSVTTPWETIVDADPEVMIVACCGFDVERAKQDLPILKSYRGWDRLRCVRNDRVYIVDGSAYFSRPGPRLIDSLEILAHALHPATHPLPTQITEGIDFSIERIDRNSPQL
ncbi:corrinoid ABC transporter substrate-binding protein [Rosistilla ulvae]|uniref:Corrinoid ABC transporter substrate-binding protein n=1 Tax=Rosistilla ulvae TaxID=1930277 RepID=A0A517M133_9BACT|nr:cobalamin-binding protein [Rosistilla ulvae]QDS88566.1 corrinoid ABC transporter substrate-binding protein [Rosistilla ulvae]